MERREVAVEAVEEVTALLHEDAAGIEAADGDVDEDQVTVHAQDAGGIEAGLQKSLGTDRLTAVTSATGRARLQN